MHEETTHQHVSAVRPDREVLTRQRLPYFIGVSAATVGARCLSMHLVVIPPGARAAPHVHEGYETAIYVLEGRVETRFGRALEQSVVSEAGDFLFIPPGIPHEAINLSETAAARAVVARNDANEQERVIPYPAGGSSTGNVQAV
ncbi:MAG TPA: cupin domain-containing protein [Noviherbaspirillum sp.]|nr:cupin domain-containing protein [Noviherbaspirillum sp.]